MTPIRQDDDAALCRAAQAGDRRAEETLIIRYTRLVRRCAHPLFLMGGDGEDLIQEGLLGLLSAIRDFDDTKAASFATFAETCVRHRLSSAVQTANRRKHTPLNTSLPLDTPELSQTAAADDDPEQWFIGREERRELNRVLRGILTKIENDVLGLYCDGYSYREIAATLHTKPKTVDNAVQRIKKKLGKRISATHE